MEREPQERESGGRERYGARERVAELRKQPPAPRQAREWRESAHPKSLADHPNAARFPRGVRLFWDFPSRASCPPPWHMQLPPCVPVR